MSKDKFKTIHQSFQDLKKFANDGAPDDKSYEDYKKRIDEPKRKELKPHVDRLVDNLVLYNKESAEKRQKELSANLIANDAIIKEADMEPEISKKLDSMKIAVKKEVEIPVVARIQNGLEMYSSNEEEAKIQKEIYKKYNYWKEKLNSKSENEKTLLKFEVSPYIWMVQSLKNAKRKEEEKLKETKDEKEIENIKLRISLDDKDLDLFGNAWKRKIPLGLERNEHTKNIFFEDGKVFDSGKIINNLNKYFKKKNKSYTVGNVFQRRNSQYLILKTSEGNEVEINIKKINDIVANGEKKFNTKQDKIKKEKAEKSEGISGMLGGLLANAEKREQERAKEIEEFLTRAKTIFSKGEKEVRAIEKKISTLEKAYEKQREEDRNKFVKGLKPMKMVE